MFPFTKKYSLLWKECCLHQIRKTIEKKDIIWKQLLFTSSWKKGGSGQKPLAATKQKTRENSKNQKNLEKTKKTIKPKKSKKNINSRLFRKLGCFTKTPWELLFWFYCFFCFLDVFWFFEISRVFLLIFSCLQVLGVVFHFFCCSKLLFNYLILLYSGCFDFLSHQRPSTGKETRHWKNIT